MAGHHAALRHAIATPQRLEDLLARDDVAAVGCEQVQQTLLESVQMDLGGAGAHFSMEDVDFDLAESEHGFNIRRVVVSSPSDGYCPRQQLLQRERDRHDI